MTSKQSEAFDRIIAGYLEQIADLKGFLNTAERPIARDFAGRRGELEAACRRLGGRPTSLGMTAWCCASPPCPGCP